MMSATPLCAAEPRGGVPAVLLACAGLLCHAGSHAALPGSAEPAAGPAGGATHAPDEPASEPPVLWTLPPLRWGGNLAYSHRRDSADGVNSMQSGLSTTVNASTSGFIWQPWFARVDAALGFTKVSSNSEGDLPANNSASEGVLVTGRGQLSVLSQSKFPFEAHFEKTDNQVDTNLAASSDVASQRYGFTQRYFQTRGESSLAWDRNTQTSSNFGSDQQESLELRSAHNQDAHQLQLSANRTVNRHDNSGESAAQDNLTTQHHYTPGPALSVLSMANLSNSELHLQQGDNRTQLAQFSSNAFWQSATQALSVNGGVRALTLAADQAGLVASSDGTSGTRLLTANANAGLNYDYSRLTRLNASLNVGSVQSGPLSSTQSSQTLGANYLPDSIALGAVDYHWALSANAFNRSSSEEAQSGLSLQLSHGLNRSYTLDGGSTIRLSGNQGLLASSTRGNPAYAAGIPQPSERQLTHSGSASWDLLQQTGAALIRLSVSDARALDADRAYFQLLNFQASSNLPTSGYSSWTGSLTLQAVRQGRDAVEGDVQADASNTTSASGALSYQTQRIFGVRNLRFGSDLRLNLQSQQSQRAFLQQSFFSQLQSRSDQETAAWVNHLDYAIGRTQLRLQLLVSRSTALRDHAGTGAAASNQATEERTNRSLYFTVIRRFGQY